MSNIYYKIQFKTEINTLNIDLKNSKCLGFFIPKRLLLKRGTKELDKNFVKILKILDKKIILYENYYTSQKKFETRPSLIDPDKIEDDNSAKSIKQQNDNFLKNCNQEDIQNFFLKEINEYNEIIKRILALTKEKPSTKIEEKLFKKPKNFEILGYTIPYFVSIPYSVTRKSYFKKYQKFIQEAQKIYEELILKNVDSYKLNEQFLTIPITLKDYLTNKKILIENVLFKNCQKYKKIILWIIDFNDVYATKNEIEAYEEIIRIFNKKCESLYIFCIGVFSNCLKLKINSNIKGIIRTNGYPGLNVNIPIFARKTKRFYFQGNGNFYNDNTIDDILSSPFIKHNCDCRICNENKIKDLNKVKNFFIEDPIKNPDYEKHKGRAKATLIKKLKGLQSSFLFEHNFYNIDKQLDMSCKELKKIFFQYTNIALVKWKEFI